MIMIMVMMMVMMMMTVTVTSIVIVACYVIRYACPQVNISEECREQILVTDVTAYDIFDAARAEVLAVMEVRLACVRRFIHHVHTVHQAIRIASSVYSAREYITTQQ